MIIGLLAGTLIGFLRGHWILLGLDGLLATIFLVVGYTPLMTRIAPKWVRSDPIPADADAIVVLSAGVLSDTALNVEGTERLISGLELFQRGIAPRLFTTEVENEYPDGVRSTTPDQARLIKLAGATAAWTVLQGVFTTRDEALQSAVKLPEGARRLVVVTSPMHTRRACATFHGASFSSSRTSTSGAREHSNGDDVADEQEPTRVSATTAFSRSACSGRRRGRRTSRSTSASRNSRARSG